jgi:hypothetical protein
MEGTVQEGAIRRQGQAEVIGRWRADSRSLAIETADADLRRAADEILRRPQTIPVHGPSHLPFAAEAVPAVELPTTIKHLALVALELEARGFVLDAEDTEPGPA